MVEPGISEDTSIRGLVFYSIVVTTTASPMLSTSKPVWGVVLQADSANDSDIQIGGPDLQPITVPKAPSFLKLPSVDLGKLYVVSGEDHEDLHIMGYAQN